MIVYKTSVYEFVNGLFEYKELGPDFSLMSYAEIWAREKSKILNRAVVIYKYEVMTTYMAGATMEFDVMEFRK